MDNGNCKLCSFFGLFSYFIFHMHVEMHAVQLILLTCDLPNSSEYIEFFWVQSFNVVIDIPVNYNGRSETKQKDA